jgi:hypothetical protein
VALNLRNPETQAKFSGYLVVASAAMLVLAVILASAKGGFSWETREFVYQSNTKRAPIIFGISFVTLVLSSVSFWFAYSSAGERRNPRSGLSWACFACSAALITFTCIFVAAFKFAASVIQKST